MAPLMINTILLALNKHNGRKEIRGYCIVHLIIHIRNHISIYWQKRLGGEEREILTAFMWKTEMEI